MCTLDPPPPQPQLFQGATIQEHGTLTKREITPLGRVQVSQAISSTIGLHNLIQEWSRKIELAA
jgi:hypothetical protein